MSYAQHISLQGHSVLSVVDVTIATGNSVIAISLEEQILSS